MARAGSLASAYRAASAQLAALRERGFTDAQVSALLEKAGVAAKPNTLAAYRRRFAAGVGEGGEAGSRSLGGGLRRRDEETKGELP